MLYKVYFYSDASGYEPVLEYMHILEGRKDKDSRVKLNKINDYILILNNMVPKRVPHILSI